MLYDIYAAIKTRLATLALPQEWYNVQYEETIINDNGLFVEFPDKLTFAEVSKDMRRAPVMIRMHVYSKALRTSDGIPDATVQAHEVLALQLKGLLDGWTPAGTKASRLKFTDWHHWHRYKGWMVTFVEFDAKIVL